MNINATLFVQALSFAALIWFSVRFVWPMITDAMDERTKRIADGLARDEPLIAFPSTTYLLAWGVSVLPLPLKDVLAASGLFAEVRYDRGGGGGGAGRAQPLTRDS